jgi:hypothetical protein
VKVEDLLLRWPRLPIFSMGVRSFSAPLEPGSGWNVS